MDISIKMLIFAANLKFNQMETIIKGHKYLLDNFEDQEADPQHLQFICKEKVGDEFRTMFDGTTNEEVLAVLIDRMQYLQKLFPCRENAIVITNLEESLMWLNKRTRDREARGVEGKPEK